MIVTIPESKAKQASKMDLVTVECGGCQKEVQTSARLKQMLEEQGQGYFCGPCKESNSKEAKTSQRQCKFCLEFYRSELGNWGSCPNCKVKEETITPGMVNTNTISKEHLCTKCGECIHHVNYFHSDLFCDFFQL